MNATPTPKTGRDLHQADRRRNAVGAEGGGTVRAVDWHMGGVVCRRGVEPICKSTKEIGRFEGDYTLRRLRRGEYLCVPDPGDPFRFVRPNGEVIVVTEAVFTSDLGTIPRIFWPFIAPNDIERASLIHDVLFDREKIGVGVHSLREVNRILGEASRAEGCRRLTCWLIRKACDWFGGRLWRSR